MLQKVKKISVLLAVLMLFTVSLGALEAVSVNEFSDVPREYWGYKTIMDMTKAGIFKGTEEPVNGVGVFSPDKIMTRAEFITASLRAIFPEEAKNVAIDGGKWWSGYYAFAIDKGIVKSGEFDGGDLEKEMTREEMAMVMVRCVGKNGEKLSKRVSLSQIPDYSKIGDFYKDYVRDCFSFGLLCGVDENGTFAPAKSLTRAEAATVVCRLLDKDMRIKVEFAEKPSNVDKPQSSNKDDKEETVVLPWENGGKQPSEYTMAEFEALTDKQKGAFIESFGSADAFSAWMSAAQKAESTAEPMPWEDGGKQPSEYTMAEFSALTDKQKSAFIESFGSADAFSAWMSAAQKAESTVEPMPWENGGKQPSEYTMAEFEALKDTQKSAFIESFGSADAFSAWMSAAQKAESTVEPMPWENGGKQPSEYTMAEFEALTDKQKSAFVESFGSSDAFDKWMSKAQDTDSATEELPWENGGKKPSEYTMAEFGALTDKQKAAFVESFGSTEVFEEWLNSNQS